MGNIPSSDTRIKFSIGCEQSDTPEGLMVCQMSLAFDTERELLYVCDCGNHQVQVFSSKDGSFVSSIAGRGDTHRILRAPVALAIDHEHGRIFVTEQHRLQVISLEDHSLLTDVERRSAPELLIWDPRGIAIDKHHRRIIISDTDNHRLVFLSLVDLSFLFATAQHRGVAPGVLNAPTGVAIDHDRHRIIVTDSENHRVQVLSSIDGSFLFEFGSKGDQPGQLNNPQGLCIANQGRIIVADYYNRRLQSFTHEGHHISSFQHDSTCLGVAFDEHRGLIAFTTSKRVHVIGANQWLPNTFTWRPDRHRYAPSWIKQAVSTMTMIRSVVDDSASISMIPNELLFEIFSFL